MPETIRDVQTARQTYSSLNHSNKAVFRAIVNMTVALLLTVQEVGQEQKRNADSTQEVENKL